MRRLALVPILVSAFLFPSAAAALGLGEIELQSALNQRLDAEIPLRGVPADRADDVIVTLASEQAFQDVGLQRPFALTKLQFEVKQRPDGDYYVHLTSDEAIVEPFLSFLVEVDWPGGNLLREYTVLLDPPVFTTEKADEGDDAGAPEAAGDDVAAEGVPGEIERAEEADEATQRSAAATAATADEAPAVEDETTTAEAPAAGDEPATTATDTDPAAETGARETVAAEGTRTRGGDFGDMPLFLEVEREEEEAEQRLAERQAAERDRAEQEAQTRAYEEGATDDAGTGTAAAGPDLPNEYGPVRQGETLWGIASRLKGGDMTVQQMMLALLRYNPEAFAGDNINRLRQGYVLRVPDASEVRSVSAQQAVARVGEQNALWQEWRRAQGADATRRAAREEEEARATAEAETGADAASGEGDEARLSIVGSDEGGAASDEQASATSASDQSTSEALKLARERLESAEMEKAELRSRVDELEQTVDKMERLITLREERLSELQQQLEELRQQRAEATAEAEAAPADEAAAEEEAAGADETAEDDTTVAAAGDGGSGDGGAGASGDTGGGADDPGTTTAESDAGAAETAETGDAGAGDEGTTATDEATADAGESATAEDGGADAAASDATAAGDDSGVVTTRTEPAEKGWLDTLTGMASSVAATVTGVIAGLAAGAGGGLFAGPTSPGFLGAAALLVLALVLMLVRRRRAAAEPAAADADAASFEAIAGEADDWTAEEEADVASMERGSEVMAEELEGAEAGADDAGRAAAPDLAEEHFDFGALGEAGGDQAGEDEDAPKDDTVAEADVYLAYGLHQQAEDLLRLALKESPRRSDYHEKLLETLYGAGKRDEFVAVARDFRGLAETPQGRPWQRVVAMGKEIAPDEAMFSDAADPGIRPDELHQRKPETTDIELDPGSDSHVDFGLDDAAAPAGDAHSETQMFETGAFDAGPDAAPPGTQGPAAAEADAGGELEFDLGELGELGGGQPQAEAAPQAGEDDPEATAVGGGGDDDALEFDLGDLDLGEPQPETPAAPAAGEDDPGATAVAGGGPGPGPDAGIAAAGAEADDEEIDPEATVAASGEPDFSLDFDDTRTPAVDTGAPAGPDSGGLDAGGASAEAGAGDDDDALDLGDIDLGDSGHEDTPEETAAAGGADEEALDLGDLGRGEAGADEETAVSAGGADDALDLDAPDRDEETAVGGGADDDGAFDLSDLDAEFADMAGEGGGSDEDTAGSGDDETRFDFDVGGLDDEVPAGEDTADSAGDDVPEATPAAAGGAAAGAAAEDDEFDTMLDLAKAYIDMGDAESASNALEEVIQSGNEAQQREARGLLETVQ